MKFRCAVHSPDIIATWSGLKEPGSPEEQRKPAFHIADLLPGQQQNTESEEHSLMHFPARGSKSHIIGGYVLRSSQLQA